MKILLLAMMEQEARPVIDFLKLQKQDQQCEICDYFIQNDICLVIPKQCQVYKVDQVGTDVAYLQGYLGIKFFNPDLVINFGSCGAIKTFNNLLKVGDICYANEKAKFIDRSILFEQFDKYIKGNYDIQIDQKYLDLFESQNIKPARVGTRNTFSSSFKELVDNNCDLVEMECASFAKICQILKKPFIALKSISDVMDLTDQDKQQQHDGNQQNDKHLSEQFESNLDSISNKLSKELIRFIQKIQL